MSENSCELCGRPHGPGHWNPGLSFECLQIGCERLKRDIAAAEERGRRRGVEERDKLRETLKDLFALVEEGLLVRNIGNDGDPGWTMNAMRIVLALKHAKDDLAPRDSAPVCDAVVSSDPFREWRCAKSKGHEGPHSGEAPRDSGKARK